MQRIGSKIVLFPRLSSKYRVKHPSSSCISWIKNKSSYNIIFARNFHKNIEEPNQSICFKNALEFVKAHPPKSVPSKKLNIKNLQYCWALAIFLNNQEAYPFVKHSETRGDFIETWINDNILDSEHGISKSNWNALKLKLISIRASDLRHLIKILPETLENS